MKLKSNKGSVSVFSNGVNATDKAIFRLEQILEIHAAKENEKMLSSSKSIANIEAKIKMFPPPNPQGQQMGSPKKKNQESKKYIMQLSVCPQAPCSSDPG